MIFVCTVMFFLFSLAGFCMSAQGNYVVMPFEITYLNIFSLKMLV